MSTDAARTFLRHSASDEDLQRAIADAVTTSDDRNVITGQRMAELGAERGLEFTAEELREELIAGDWEASAVEGELSEDQLEQVAGGVIGDSGIKCIKWQPSGALGNIYLLDSQIGGRRGDV